jgi:hypothetical protein
MVKAVVVKGGGAGMTTDMKCAEIFASFDPEIKFGPHSKMKGTMDGYQAEHIIPTSVFHDKGRGGGKTAGCTGYSTGGATTWMVRDTQTDREEHKLLTDPMRLFSQQNDAKGKNATLKEWLDEYKEGTKNALKNAEPKRKITNKDVDENSLIDAAAECIRARAEESFGEMDPPVKLDTPLRNSWPATIEQKAKAAADNAASRSTRL